ncbi:MAG: hypothetical protein WBO35_00490 [Candidatus Saccharimonadales bacterium]
METNERGTAMDEQVARQLTRQLKIINFWITFFGTIIVVTLLVLGFFIFKMVLFVRSTEEKIIKIQTQTTQTLNVKDDLCGKSLLSGSSYCKNQ